jgi:two-component system, OmpR family, sensor histidine kinase BaeS
MPDEPDGERDRGDRDRGAGDDRHEGERRHRFNRPPWWPEDEPWPPRDRWAGRRMRRHVRNAMAQGAWHSPPDGGQPGPDAPWWLDARWRDDRWRRRRRQRIGCGIVVVLLLLFGLASAVAWGMASLLGLVAVGSSAQPGMLVLVVLGIALVVSGAVRGARRFASPVEDLLDVADRLAAGDYAARVSERGTREMRVAARALNTLGERLAAAEERRGALLADVSHELRTPLTVIRGGLEGMLDGVHPRDDAHLTTLRDEALHLDRIIEDLRTLSLAEVGALPLVREPVAPADLVEDGLAPFRAGAEASGVTLAGHVRPGLAPVEVDRVRVGEVLRNLISNALRYTPAGGSVTVSAAPGPSGSAEFVVRDTGAGLAPGDAAHIFDRFHRTADSSGSGLGLAIAREIVAAHGGRISAESAGPGRGMTVCFTLPASS